MPVEVRANGAAERVEAESAIGCTSGEQASQKTDRRRRHSLKTPRTKRLGSDQFKNLMSDVLSRSHDVLRDVCDPTVKRRIRSFAKRHIRNLERYGFAGRAGAVRAARSLEWHIASSHSARTLALILSYPSRQPKLWFSDLQRRAADVIVWRGLGEPVLIDTVAKADGGHRCIGQMGIVDRAKQELARQLCAARHGESEYEYCRRGSGRDAFVQALVDGAKDGGVRAIGTLDIKDFFPSIRKEAVYEVAKLPRSIINNTIFVSEDTPIVFLQSHHLSENAVRAGLLQGALSSPFVAGKVLEPCLDNVPARLAISYLDNIAIGGAAVCEVQAALKALTASLETQYPGAPLFTKYAKAGKIGKRIDVLGYWLRPNKKADGGGTRTTPSNEAIRRIYLRLATKLLQTDRELWEGLIDQRLTRWANSFGIWMGRTAGSDIAASQFIDMCWSRLAGVQKQHLEDVGTMLLSEAAAHTAARKVAPKDVLARLRGGPAPMLEFT